MQTTSYNGQEFINSSFINQNFKDLFNKPGPYYNCYPILGNWKNYSEIKVIIESQ